MYFGAYDGAKRLLKSGDETMTSMASWKLLMAGGIGGMAYWIITYPTDVIKTKMQSDTIVRGERTYTTIARTTQVHNTVKWMFIFLRADGKFFGFSIVDFAKGRSRWFLSWLHTVHGSRCVSLLCAAIY